MASISVDAQIFDVVFHPTVSTVYVGLLTGHVNAFHYNTQGNNSPAFSLRPSKRSCRGLSINDDGSKLYAVGKSKAIHIIDTGTESIETRSGAHESPINRVKHLTPWLLSTGDDEGVIKLWDPRQQKCTHTYTRHFDYITDFLWLDDKKHLVATSGDGTLSVMDVRSKKTEPIAQSEDQEDELLSIVAIKSASKIVVGTQIGVLSVFNRSSGWGDCVDRVPGHPMSVDALCSLPSSLSDVDTTNTILTGSSDGFVRAVQLFPTKLLGVVADHGELPVERVAIGGAEHQLSIDNNDSTYTNTIQNVDDDAEAAMEEDLTRHRRWWVGSVDHEDALRMTDLQGFFRDAKLNSQSSTQATIGAMGEGGDSDNDDSEQSRAQDSDGESNSEPEPKKKKRKRERDPLNAMDLKKKKGKNELVIDKAFFNDL